MVIETKYVLCEFLSKIFFINLKRLWSVRKRQRERKLIPITGSLSQIATQPGLDQAKSRSRKSRAQSLLQVLCLDGRDNWPIVALSSKELDQKWSYWDRNWYPNGMSASQ